MIVEERLLEIEIQITASMIKYFDDVENIRGLEDVNKSCKVRQTLNELKRRYFEIFKELYDQQFPEIILKVVSVSLVRFKKQLKNEWGPKIID